MTTPTIRARLERICREGGQRKSSSRRTRQIGAISPPLSKSRFGRTKLARITWSREFAVTVNGLQPQLCRRALGGLPLAHEQAAAYCERLGISFADYMTKFRGAPAKLLDSEKDAPADYHDSMTVAKTFAVAIDEAAKLHPAAELLIGYAALLAPEPIPLFLFSEGRHEFGEPFASVLQGMASMRPWPRCAPFRCLNVRSLRTSESPRLQQTASAYIAWCGKLRQSSAREVRIGCEACFD